MANSSANMKSPENSGTTRHAWGKDGEYIKVGLENRKTLTVDFSSVFRGDNRLAGATPGNGYGTPEEWAQASQARALTESRYAKYGWVKTRYCKPKQLSNGAQIPYILIGDTYRGFAQPEQSCGEQKYAHVEATCTSKGTLEVSEGCKPIGCPATNGFPSVELGADAQARCLAGRGGVRLRRCNMDGTWGEIRDGNCQATSCAAEAPWGETAVGQIQIMPCDGGDGEVGTMSRPCNTGGRWGRANRTNCRRGGCLAVDGWPGVQTGFQSVKACPAGQRGVQFRDCTQSGFTEPNLVQCVPEVAAVPAPSQPPVAPPPNPADIRPEAAADVPLREAQRKEEAGSGSGSGIPPGPVDRDNTTVIAVALAATAVVLVLVLAAK